MVPKADFDALKSDYDKLKADFDKRGEEIDTLKAEIEELKKPKLLKAGFIYVGPIGDVGWTAAHDRGRRIVDDKYDWLETFYEEAVAEADVGDAIDAMFEKGADVVFTTSFGYMWDTAKKAAEYPDKILYHCSGDPIVLGYDQPSNMGFYFVDFYQIYYLNGLMAGALTKTNKLGYIAAFEISELVRHINAFYVGAKEVNPDVELKVVVMGTAWYDPGTTTTAFHTLVEWGADVVAHTEDSPATVTAAQTLYEDTGERVYVFSHYTPMKEFGPDVVLSGQLVHWEKWYEHLLLKAYHGEVENWQHWGLLHGGYAEIGSDWGELINPLFVDDLKAATVTDPVLGEISVYDLIMTRLEQFKELRVTFLPFTGPIYDTEGNLRLKPGEVISTEELRWGFDWYQEGIIPPE
jgi:simple sugar transport system substrate-binding protein